MPPAHVVEVSQSGRAPILLVVVGSLELGRECAGLNLSDPLVSRRHCALLADGDGITAVDLGSTNGIRINGQPVVAPTRLGPHDVLELGTTSVQLSRELRAAPVVETSTDQFDPVSLSGPTSEHTPLGRGAMALEDLSRTVTTAPVDTRSLEQTGVTLTLVFSDIESSTQWAEQLGDQRWIEVLAAHDDIVHRCVRAMGGLVVKQRGDGFMLTFPSARRATLFAQDLQRGIGALATTHAPIRVRIGLHVGEAINVHGDLFGQHVNLAARISDAAEGGQILASPVVRELVETRGDIGFGEEHDFVLKGIEGTVTLHEVLW